LTAQPRIVLPTLEEAEAVISKIINNKAPGDSITVELIKNRKANRLKHKCE
jgi:hypothetical protein